MNPTMHTMRNGETIPISQMDDAHLLNTIKLFRSMAEGGVVWQSGGGFDAEDIWYESDVLTGQEAEDALNLQSYLDEMTRRGLKEPK